jgi:hypothetical protein
LSRRLAALAAICWFSGSALIASADSGWPQWGRTGEHQGESPVAGQPLNAILAEVLYDPFVLAELAEGAGQLNVHYAAPLVQDAAVYIEIKSGSYKGCQPPGSGQPAPCGSAAWNLQTWGVRKLAWQNGALVPAWTFQSDWKPEPNTGNALLGWEPVFHPVLAGTKLYVPGAGGTVFVVDTQSGQASSRVNPFPALDADTYVAGGLAADDAGNVYYNAIRLDPANPWTSNVLGSWLVKVDGEGGASKTPFSALAPSAPPADSLCELEFSSSLPWPPSATAQAPLSPCGSQRPGVNVIPAIAPDGTIYTVSRAHFNTRYAYLIAAKPDLTPLWSASLRDFLDDGCDVLLPPSGSPGGCRAGSTQGVDPTTNNRPAGQVWDLSTSSPVVLPDGAVLFGAQTTYNYSRGHLLKFSPAGQPVASYDFGWDSTPAVFRHDGTYSVLIKDNHYHLGSYCSDTQNCPPQKGRYDLSSLDATLLPEWHYTNTNREGCVRQSDGSVKCSPIQGDGFEWCVNQPAVDARGILYANSEDGFLYAIGRDGLLREKVFLDLAIGAAYTPVSIGPEGLLYCQNNGHLFVVGLAARPGLSAPPSPASPRQVGFH